VGKSEALPTEFQDMNGGQQKDVAHPTGLKHVELAHLINLKYQNMLSKEELPQLFTDLESDRVERTESTKNTDKFGQAICAFANDFPNHKKNGYLLLGVKDDGSLSGLKATDELLKDLASIRHNGQILPQPAMTVQKYEFDTGEVVVVEVFPAYQPPVRYKGKIWIRTGPSKSVANETEERILIEKRSSTAKTFDAQPEFGVNLGEIV
jgi:ATP-dependent DNA helicase RecG